jgi:hypothetical protein
MCNNNIFGTHKQQNLAYHNLSTNTLWLDFFLKLVEIKKNSIVMFHGQWNYQNKMNVLHSHFNILFHTINVTNFAIPLLTCYNVDMAQHIEHEINI